MKTGKAPFCKLFSNKVTNEEQSSSGLGISVQPKVLSGNPCKKQELRRPRPEASSPGGCRNAAFPLQPLGNQGRMRGTYTWGNIYHAEPTQHPPWPQWRPLIAPCSSPLVIPFHLSLQAASPPRQQRAIPGQMITGRGGSGPGTLCEGDRARRISAHRSISVRSQENRHPAGTPRRGETSPRRDSPGGNSTGENVEESSGMARKQMCSWSLQNSFLYGAA